MYDLRPITAEDLDIIYSWAQSPLYAEFFRRFPPEFMWHRTDLALTLLQQTWIVYDYNNECYGLVSLFNQDAQAKKIEFGCMIVECPTRRSIAVEACEKVANYVFDQLGYNKLYCTILEHRGLLVELLKDFGFKEEALLRDNIVYKGQFRNEIVMSVLRKDWVE